METAATRDRFVLALRSPRPTHDPWLYQDLVIEDERTVEGQPAPTATVFLTGRECPWRCVMCDLWRYTTEADTPRGAIPAQVNAARDRLRQHRPAVTHLKLYNAGSFFDPRALPEDDYGAVAAAVAGLRQVVVESHPALIGARVDRWLEALDRHRGDAAAPRLEVAMGLETAHPDALDRLNKRMTVEGFRDAAGWLTARDVSVRAFLLIAPPFVPPREQDAWLVESTRVAFDCGASVAALIPTRDGNGAMEALSADGSSRAPRLDDIERSVELALAAVRPGGRLFVDLWDLERFSSCGACFPARRDRLHRMNLTQQIPPPIACGEH